jgi:hypothetical protein
MVAALPAAAEETPSQRCTSAASSGDNRSATYARRGKYCDGAVRENYAGPGELPVIGVMSGVLSGDVSAKPRALGVMSAGSLGAALVELHGTAKDPKKNYRFDAGLRGGTVEIGHESAMTKVRPPLRLEDIAWVAWRDTPAVRTYFPVVAVGSSPSMLEIIVRPSFAASYVVYSVRAGGKVLRRDSVVHGTNAPGEPVSFTVEAGQPRLIDVEITAVAEDGETQIATFRTIRPAK